MGSILEKFLWAWKETSEIKKRAYSVMYQYQADLRKGTWKLRWCGKPVLYRTSSKYKVFYKKCKREFSEMVPPKAVIRNCIQNVFSFGWQYRCAQDDRHDWKADYVMLSRNGSVYFYDLEKKIVKKYYESDVVIKKYNKLKEAGYWDFFSSPIIFNRGLISYEKIIFGEQIENCDSDRYKYVLKKYKEYLHKAKPVKIYSVFELIASGESNIPQFSKIFSESFLRLSLNGYMLHGDFYASNVIYDGIGRPYVIDYEHADVYPFAYDILFWIWLDILWRGDWKLWELLLSSETEIGKVFHEILEMQHIPDSRQNKVALMTLTAFARFQCDIQKKNNIKWSKRDLTNFYRNRFETNIQKLSTYL